MEPVSSFFRYLWRHRIVQVGVAYLVTGWAVFQVVSPLTQTLHLADWIPKMTLVLLALGFPPALILAWAWGGVGARTGAAQDTVRPSPLPPGARRSIAVLPFANLSREREDEIFADGIVEDLITGLSMNSDLSVISRSSTFSYKGASPDVRQVGADLGAAFVLEGSVRRLGDRLRVTVQLIETATGGHLWAEKYDRPTAELFTLQDDLVCSIAAALEAEIDRAEMIRVRNNPASVSAWEEAQRANYIHARPSLATMTEAIAHGRKAVALDPNFALAHARLGLALSTASQMLGAQAGKAFREESYAHMQRALSLAPNDSAVMAHAASALAHTGHAEEGLRHGMRALELNPNDAAVYGSVGNALFRLGRAEEAFKYYDEEERLAPKSVWLNARYLYRGLAWVTLGKLDNALAAFTRSVQGDPSFEQAWLCLATTQGLRGEPAAAAAAARQLRTLNPQVPQDAWAAAIAGGLAEPMSSAAVAAFRQAWADSEA